MEARWDQGLEFEAVGRAGVPVRVDGNTAAAVSPVETLGVGLATCMAADVVDILTKMRVPLSGLTVVLEADRAPDPPRRYTAVHLLFQVTGVADADRSKLDRAVALSKDTYCSVLHTLRPDLELTFRIEAA